MAADQPSVVPLSLCAGQSRSGLWRINQFNRATFVGQPGAAGRGVCCCILITGVLHGGE